MKKSRKVSLQTKIVSLIIALILFVVLLLAGIFVYIQSVDTKRQVEQLALQTAKSLSFMPAIKEAFQNNEHKSTIQSIAEQVREQAGADYVIIEDRFGVMYSHSNSELIGTKSNNPYNYEALTFGGYYTLEGNGESSPALMAKAPIIVYNGDYDQVVGVVTVEFLIKGIESNILSRTKEIILFSLAVLLVGIVGGILLARSIRKDTLGLEPNEIAALYRERSAILLSIKEGIIAIDQNGFITMMNTSAEEMLHVNDDYMQQHISKILPEFNMERVLENDQEIAFQDKVFILNRTPILENNSTVGVVCSFRDKTELQNLVNTISEVRKYSEDLRAQTHEFTNKLFVLSGLLQLGHYKEAIEFIQQESNIHQSQNHILFHQIHDAKVQAILLGKLATASERKIDFHIEGDSALHPLPEHIKVSHLITILGNIIDNAFDAVSERGEKNVSFFVTDIGHDIVFEVIDSGIGIPEEKITTIFQKGFSTKGNDRGYGLANVKEMVDLLGGTIEIQNEKNGGAIFTIYLPKTLKEST
ncbi:MULTISPECIES: sensor histidine kinase [Bacillus]|uniref:ATP-binding protein n=1 Tax=Bacillus TaxID=1386 RepID=UPI000473DB24|nr:sensor histidine kinase [Bacillus cereus]ANE84322.1 ATPase [Bacillus cereus]MBY0016965.1 sensor histidine kinase [Bacillus cereus]MDA2061219.1 sensor histidine kinase [Bacillus cereus]MDZ4414541.1 sensor histidine kinase [Bacillus cereus]MDZ4498388.1 sensor histidine kinase [Bacillus cereus]